MNILWISSIAWKSEQGYPFPVNGAGAVSGSLFEQALIEELEKQGHCVDIIADYPYAPGTNPHCKQQWSHNGMSDDTNIKTIDIPYFSLLYKTFKLKVEVKTKLSKKDYDFVIAYLIHRPFMESLTYAKHIFPKTKTILICPDLPDMMDMSLSSKKIKAFLKKIDMKRIKTLYKKTDGFVLFTEAMKEKIDLVSKPYVVIEGIASINDLDLSPVAKEPFVMYAGSLQKNFGIENIIKSLDFISDKNIKLKIYGTGELESYIRKKAEENPRIIFGGFIDRQALFTEEKKAIALINARNPENEYTRYSFPSKTFEYLYSGTPFITTKLAGLSDEYSQFLHKIENNSPEIIALHVNKIIETDEQSLFEAALKAKNFITENKNSKKQGQVFLDFLNNFIT